MYWHVCKYSPHCFDFLFLYTNFLGADFFGSIHGITMIAGIIFPVQIFKPLTPTL